MTQQQAIRVPILAMIIFLVAALFARSFLQLRLQNLGYNPGFAKDLSFLVVPPILAVLMYPIFREHKDHLSSLFQRQLLSWRLVLAALAVGLLMRIAWWCQLIVRISFGITKNADPEAIVGPSFSFNCPPGPVIVLGVFVMAMLVPVIEEVTDRGLIQSSLVHRGKSQAIMISALVFAAFHPPASYPLTFVAGVILGIQFWNSGTLWFSVITHATYNGLIQLDWRCINGTWNPLASDLPLYAPGTVGLVGLILSVAGIGYLIRENRAGAR